MRFARTIPAALAIVLSAVSAWSEDITESVGRNGVNRPDDVLTVQILLNQLAGDQGGPEAMLVPDGVNGPKTIAAIERFQTHKFGQVDAHGRIDPGKETLKRLNQLVEAQPLDNRIVSVARGERLFWQDGKRKELDDAISTRLQKYWKAVGLDYSVEQLRDSKFQSDNPWSAAFVSWVMKKAGAGDHFRYAASHWQYVAAAKENRSAGNTSPFVAYRTDEKTVELADIVVKRRSNSTATYENIEKGHMTHGDIVVSVADGTAETIGGNVGDSVRMTPVKLSDDLKVSADGYFAIVKVN